MQAARATHAYEELIVGDYLEEISLIKNNTYDMILAIDSIQYISDVSILFANVSRVLRKDGLFVFSIDLLEVGRRGWMDVYMHLSVYLYVCMYVCM